MLARNNAALVRSLSRMKWRVRPRRLALHGFLIVACSLWLLPVLWALYTSLRPYADTAARGYVSLPGALNLGNYVDAWNEANLPHYYLNTLIVVVPAAILTIGLASMVAFAVSRFAWRLNVAVLLLFTAGNLLPPQVIITPLYRMYLLLPLPAGLSDNGVWYDQYFGVIAIHTAFQMGFCTFVLSNYMKTIPQEIIEAAIVDGASVFAIWRKVVLPLCTPALAALATLMFTWIYNDFFWALVLMETGTKLPITSGLNDLQVFFTNFNLLAFVIVAIPPLYSVYFLFQRQFVRGLMLGATKG